MDSNNTPSRSIMPLIIALGLLTLLSIWMGVREVEIISDLKLGVDVADNVLLFNDIAQLILLASQVVIFVTLGVFLNRSYKLTKSKMLDAPVHEWQDADVRSSRLSFLAEAILTKSKMDAPNYGSKTAYKTASLIAILFIVLFNPLMRIALNSIYPAENLFHYAQQARITLIVLILQLFWIVLLFSTRYFANKKNRSKE